MPKRMSDARRIELGYGTGHGKDYKPWLKSGRFSSKGVSAAFPDWKHRRMIELMSQGELWFYVISRWNDNVVDIREQYPLLPLAETTEIAELLNVKPAVNGHFVMTTDFLIDLENGKQIALSVKQSRQNFADRQKELALVEEEYWSRRGVAFSVGYKEDLDPVMVRNLRDCLVMYDASVIRDDIGLVRHLIARKVITNIDFSKPFDYPELVDRYKETDVWKEMKSRPAFF